MTDLNENSAKFCKITRKITKINGAKDCKFEFGAVQRNANLVDLEKFMLRNAPSLAIVAVHTEENEPKV